MLSDPRDTLSQVGGVQGTWFSWLLGDFWLNVPDVFGKHKVKRDEQRLWSNLYLKRSKSPLLPLAELVFSQGWETAVIVTNAPFLFREFCHLPVNGSGVSLVNKLPTEILLLCVKSSSLNYSFLFFFIMTSKVYPLLIITELWKINWKSGFVQGNLFFIWLAMMLNCVPCSFQHFVC